jgi:signal transduction histidine kinase
LAPGNHEELFRPYEQRGGDRTGMGLGLAISRKGALAVGGSLTVRDVPGTGCVFTVTLRRSAAE